MLSPSKYFLVQQCSKKEARIIQFTIIFFIVFSLLNIYFNPYKFIFELFNVHTVNGCPLLTFTGVPCPMCGMGRVFSCLTDFYIARSFYYNPLGLLFYLIMGFAVGAVLILSSKNKKIIITKAGFKLWYLPVLFLIIMWLMNILYGHHH